MTFELTSLIPLVGSLVENPLAVKHLYNRLYMSGLAKKRFFCKKKKPMFIFAIDFKDLFTLENVFFKVYLRTVQTWSTIIYCCTFRFFNFAKPKEKVTNLTFMNENATNQSCISLIFSVNQKISQFSSGFQLGRGKVSLSNFISPSKECDYVNLSKNYSFLCQRFFPSSKK